MTTNEHTNVPCGQRKRKSHAFHCIAFMKLLIEFSTDNDAFHDDSYGETERILNEVLQEVAHHRTKPIKDINGNTIGQWSWKND